MRFRVLKCSRCGASISFVDGAVNVTCESCGEVVALDSALAEELHRNRKFRNTTPLKPGMKARFGSVDYELIGRIVWSMVEEGEKYYWTEFQLLGADGSTYFLELDEGQWKLSQKFTPLTPFDPTKDYSVGMHVTLDSAAATITDRAVATIEHIEGELTYRAEVGDVMQYVDAKRVSTFYSVEWTEESIEYYRGRYLSEREVLQAFDLKELLAAADRKAAARASRGKFALVCLGASILAFVFWGMSFGAGKLISQNSVDVTRIGPDGVRFGPIKLDPANRVHRLEINGQMRESSVWISGVLETAAGDEFFNAQGDLWDESGTDSDGYWHESDLSASTDFVVTKPGDYYVRLYAEQDRPGSVNQIAGYRLFGGVIYPWYLLAFAICSLIVSIIFFAMANPEAVKSMAESASDD